MKIIPILTQCLLLSFALQANDQPNIIFMLADDLGYGDLSSYNPDAQGQAPTNTAIRTPY